MAEKNDKGLLHRLVFGRGGPEPERKEMTRGQQTAWIIVGMTIIAFLGANYLQYQEDPCTSIFAGNKLKCRTDAMLERLGDN